MYDENAEDRKYIEPYTGSLAWSRVVNKHPAIKLNRVYWFRCDIRPFFVKVIAITDYEIQVYKGHNIDQPHWIKTKGFLARLATGEITEA